jgi:hypothetical protein
VRPNDGLIAAGATNGQQREHAGEEISTCRDDEGPDTASLAGHAIIPGGRS